MSEYRQFRSRLETVAAGVALFAVIGVAGAAQPSGGYVGIGFGSTTMQSASDALLGDSFDDTDSSWKLVLGYQASPNFAAEFAFVDLGAFRGKSSGVTVDDWEAQGFSMDAVGLLPLGGGEFSLFAKFGLFLWDVDDRFLGFSATASGSDLKYGFGAQFDFSPQLAARVEWERFTDVGDEFDTGMSDIDMASLSLLFRF